jgi:hypothetical protein
MRMGGVEEQMHVFFASLLVSGESASCTSSLPPRGRFPGAHLTEGRMDLRIGLDDTEKTRTLPVPDSNSGSSVAQPITSGYNECK